MLIVHKIIFTNLFIEDNIVLLSVEDNELPSAIYIVRHADRQKREETEKRQRQTER